MSSVSCIIITTLVVVSLANLVLLVHVIMNSMTRCDQSRTVLKKSPKIIKREDSVTPISKNFRTNYKFAAALVILEDEDDNFEFVCGVAVISKKWVLTTAHCVDPVLDEPRDRVKISSSTHKSKYEIWYDVDKMMVHEKYKYSPSTFNVALISVQQIFKEKGATYALLPSRSYKYLANTSATLLGWTGPELLSRDVKLLSHRNCHSVYREQITDFVFCVDRKSCFSDFGGFLIQKDLLVGVVSFGVGCGAKPLVFTKVSMFDVWFKDEKIAAVFKD